MVGRLQSTSAGSAVSMLTARNRRNPVVQDQWGPTIPYSSCGCVPPGLFVGGGLITFSSVAARPTSAGSGQAASCAVSIDQCGLTLHWFLCDKDRHTPFPSPSERLIRACGESPEVRVSHSAAGSAWLGICALPQSPEHCRVRIVYGREASPRFQVTNDHSCVCHLTHRASHFEVVFSRPF
jgi:hypothetical protein